MKYFKLFIQESLNTLDAANASKFREIEPGTRKGGHGEGPDDQEQKPVVRSGEGTDHFWVSREWGYAGHGEGPHRVYSKMDKKTGSITHSGNYGGPI